MELFFFYLFGGAAVGTGVAVVTAKNPINSAIFLILTFLSLAGIYVLLNAHFLAVIQVLVYAGAIMVLFLFVIMLLNLNKEDLGESRVNFFKVGGVVLILVVAGKLIGRKKPWPDLHPMSPGPLSASPSASRPRRRCSGSKNGCAGISATSGSSVGSGPRTYT